jgi:L-ascorbate metabolism protein UlaG (beta-lactamase superfamily)
MEKLTGYGKQGNEFIALLPVSGTYTMAAEEAAEAAALLKPSLAIPMHYGAGVCGTIEDAQRFVKLCKDKGVNAKILEKGFM